MSTDYRPRFLVALKAQKQAFGRPLTHIEIIDVCHLTAEILIAEAEKGWESRRKARVKAGIHPDAEKVYSLYPKKAGKEDALKAITSALKKHPLEYLLDKTAQFSACVANWPSSYRYFADGGDRVWNPKNFFEKGHFEDDPKEWKRHGSRSAPPPVKQNLQEPMNWRAHFPDYIHVHTDWTLIDTASQTYICQQMAKKENTA